MQKRSREIGVRPVPCRHARRGDEPTESAAFSLTMSTRILLGLVVAALLLSGCGGGSSDTSDSTAATSGAAGSAGGTDGPGSKKSPSASQPTGEPAPKASPQKRREAPVVNLSMQSPSANVTPNGLEFLPARYTCDGENTSPALRWQGVPQETAELILFTMDLQPVEGKLFFNWAVAGLSPELEEIEAGKLPEGAIVGRNSFGEEAYEICPDGEGEKTYIFALFALPKSLSPSPGFEPFALRKEANLAFKDPAILALRYTQG
jgi:phosphatidylethanolamine-binding protein (PEBP) family uncharacterized protein